MNETFPLANRQQRNGITATAWQPDGSMELESWLEHGRRLGVVGRGVAWWIGDWLRYGNARFGEKYSRAARITGYDRQSLMNMAYVASRFPPERRRAEVSWSHHAEVAALPPAKQEEWLDRAQHNRLSVGSLRQELRSARRAGGPDKAPADQDATVGTTVVCPACRRQIDL
jgi:hypothetical protein